MLKVLAMAKKDREEGKQVLIVQYEEEQEVPEGTAYRQKAMKIL